MNVLSSKLSKHLRLATLGFCAIAAVSAPAAIELPKVEPGWELISSGDGVDVHRKQVEGSDLVAFRGETIIDGNIAKVASVLYDTSRKTEWVAKIVSAKDIRSISERERVEYNHTASGFFMVRDRDFVFHASAELDKPNKRMILRLKSVEDPLMPPTDRVRGEIKSGTYVLTSVANDTKTHVVVEMHVDPKGSLPKWLVNLFQKSWPKTTLENIQKQVHKADVPELASVRQYFFESPTQVAEALKAKPVKTAEKAATPQKTSAQ